VELLVTRIGVYIELDWYNEALYDLELLISNNPDNIDLYFTRIDVYLELERYDEALYDLELLIQDDPENPELFRARVTVYEVMGEYIQSKEDFHTASVLEIDAENLEPYHPMFRGNPARTG